MGHLIERATTGRARCRGCNQPIGKGELRFGERVPNPFADDKETTLWFHLTCAAYKRPEPLLEALSSQEASEAPAPAERTWLSAQARLGMEHHRLPRIDGAQRATTGRAACRACRETIAKGEWRIKLTFFENGRFEPSGYVHVRCAGDYFGHPELLERLRHFSGDLADADGAEIARELSP